MCCVLNPAWYSVQHSEYVSQVLLATTVGYVARLFHFTDEDSEAQRN